MNYEKEKELASAESVKLVKDGMVVGLGSGSTAAYMVKELGKRVASGLSIVGVPSSENTRLLAIENGIPLKEFGEIKKIDINIDGADEFDPYLRLIKGGGGALLREKILAHNSKVNIIIADSGKQVKRLGAFKLPVEVIPFAASKIKEELTLLNLSPVLRKVDGSVFVTDEQNYILDIDISNQTNLTNLEIKLKSIPGLVETGLFIETTSKVIMGVVDKTVVLQK
ncbi:ribose-5-phosphate isomerase RpiA [Maribellus comscasis]|uniref:Ribose-5-phosphate isomerase A n=1 Tax=Maribellus comscasis TaxID=2681766 RepID=A0A6I6JT51_9BACT|nr:ribose-5-phosphate isomerase RpiA [Maribellus comscasis]QGY45641.1 ribose-5-phosphate isomerase RpiA [Maribellus comscasis]